MIAVCQAASARAIPDPDEARNEGNWETGLERAARERTCFRHGLDEAGMHAESVSSDVGLREGEVQPKILPVFWANCYVRHFANHKSA